MYVSVLKVGFFVLADKPIQAEGRRTPFNYLFFFLKKKKIGIQFRRVKTLFTYKNKLYFTEIVDVNMHNVYTSSYGRSLLVVLAQQENMAANSVANSVVSRAVILFPLS